MASAVTCSRARPGSRTAAASDTASATCSGHADHRVPEQEAPSPGRSRARRRGSIGARARPRTAARSAFRPCVAANSNHATAGWARNRTGGLWTARADRPARLPGRRERPQRERHRGARDEQRRRDERDQAGAGPCGRAAGPPRSRPPATRARRTPPPRRRRTTPFVAGHGFAGNRRLTCRTPRRYSQPETTSGTNTSGSKVQVVSTRSTVGGASTGPWASNVPRPPAGPPARRLPCQSRQREHRAHPPTDPA